MGWKAIKDRYRIGHLVSVHKGKGICIGSGYVHDLIRINPETRNVEWGNLGPSTNDHLARYWDEIHQDIQAFWHLVDADDMFDRDLPVFTYEDGAVVQYLCEEYGWPNVTHDGQMMYDNTFFEKEADARMAGVQNAKAGIQSLEATVDRAKQDLAEREGWLAERRSNLAKLLSQA